MNPLSDSAVARLADLVGAPELPGDRYALLGTLGSGGMGVVYLALDRPLERHVAIKVLRTARDAADLGARLEREARTIARLDHASVVPIHEIGALADGRPYYVMKHVAGSTLREWRRGESGDLERLRVCLRCCEAIAHAHALGVVHRDLKPDNVMVGTHGELYVMDWGLAKHVGDVAEVTEPSRSAKVSPHATEHGVVLGTPGYMAPEQARGESGSVGPAADVFALGGLLAFAWSGADPPLDGEVELRGASRPLRAIVRKARANEPAARYASAAELAADVARYLDRESVSAYREGPVERLARVLDRNRFVAWLVVGYVTLRVLVFLFARR